MNVAVREMPPDRVVEPARLEALAIEDHHFGAAVEGDDHISCRLLYSRVDGALCRADPLIHACGDGFPHGKQLRRSAAVVR